MDELIAVVRHPLGRMLPLWDITGMFNMAQECGITGCMKKFRKSVREHVISHITWTDAPPSRAATEWKGHGSKSSLRGVLTTQHARNFFGYASQAIGDTLSALTSAMERTSRNSRRSALEAGDWCSHNFKKYPHHKWIGFDMSISELGILEAAP